MPVKKVLLLFLLIPLLAGGLNAEGARPRFQRFFLEQGLLQSHISCIHQDRRGFLWLGTSSSLNRYDGYEFKVYRHIPGVPNSLAGGEVRCLFEDRDGILWVGTSGGLSRFDAKAETFSHYRNDPENPAGLSHDSIWSIHQDRSGTLWVGTSNGLNRSAPGRDTFKHYHIAREGGATQIMVIREDQSGQLWVGGPLGLHRFDPHTEQFHDSPVNRYMNSVDQRLKWIWDIADDPAGNFWIGCSIGILKFNPSAGTVKHYLEYRANCLYLRRNGILWASTARGLIRFDPRTETHTLHRHHPQKLDSLSSDLILSIFEDRSGVLWLGTLDGGLNKLTPDSLDFSHYRHEAGAPNSLSSSTVSAIHEDSGKMLWIGTARGGLNRFDPETNTFTHFMRQRGNGGGLGNNSVSAIHEDRGGKLWISTFGGGVATYDLREKVFGHYRHRPDDPNSLSSNFTSEIYVAGDGAVWIGTEDKGINRLDVHHHRFTRFGYQPGKPGGLSSNSIQAITEDRAGVLWIGTGNGLNALAPGTRKFKQFLVHSHPGGRPGDYPIQVIHEDSENRLWLGSDDGLIRFTPAAGTFKYYRADQGLPGHSIRGILEDRRGYLWLTTENSLSRFDPQTEQFKNFDSRDGLQHNEFNNGAYHRCRNGRMCFGGIRGFSTFFPNSLFENPHPPQVAITAFHRFNKKEKLSDWMSETDEMVLTYRDYSFSFEFAALDFRTPEKNLYAHKMEGFDMDWIHTDSRNRTAPYANLAPGRYVFRVKAANNSGTWNDRGVAIPITIIPPFWRTWWFTIAAVLFFALFSYVVIHFFRKYFTLIAFWKKKHYIGQYEILDQIGSGGMGAIYKARHILEHDKITAVKVIREEFVSDPKQRERFLVEAAIVDQLEHPNIVTVIERGEHNNRLFIAMEYLEGRSLTRRLREVIRLSVTEATAIMRQLLDALSKIHRQGIVHRDLKPENIMLIDHPGQPDVVKILDFGLARTQSLTRMTEKGIIIGTINYLPPEHISKAVISPAGDVYACGVIFYEMLTGEKPFLGETTLQMLRLIIDTVPVEPKVFRPDIPDSLNRLIMTMMAKEPKQRPSAEEILAALAQLFTKL